LSADYNKNWPLIGRIQMSRRSTPDLLIFRCSGCIVAKP
jgi:hypothetical protein